MSACEVVLLLPACCLAGRRLHRLMARPSCCRWVGSRWPCRVGSGCSSCVGPAWHILAVRCPLMVGRVLGGGGQYYQLIRPRSKALKFGTTCPVPPWRQRYTHNPSSCTSRCPSAVLSASLVRIICTPPSVARPLQSFSMRPRVPHGSPGVLCLLSGALLVLVSAGQSPCLRPRCARPAVCRVVPCLAAPVVRLSEVRVAWLVFWCPGVLYGAAGWAWRNIPVFAGRSQRARGARVFSPWPTSCPGKGVTRK